MYKLLWSYNPKMIYHLVSVLLGVGIVLLINRIEKELAGGEE